MRNQRDRAAPLRQVGQHAGGGAAGFVFGVQRGMQRRHGRCHRVERVTGKAERNRHGAFAKMLFQGVRHRLDLKTFNHHQQGRFSHEQPVRGIGGSRHPGQCNATHGSFVLQHRRIQAHAQRLGDRFAPRLSLGGQHSGCHAAQAPGRFHQPAGQRLLLLRQSGLPQQRSGGQHVDGHIHMQIHA